MNWGRHAPPTAPDLQPWLQAWLAAPGAPAPEAVDLRPNDRALLAAVAAAAGPVLEDWRAELHRLRREATTLRTVLDHVETAILAIRRDHHRLYANPAAERLWALGPEPAGRVTSLARLPELMAGLEEVAGGGPAWRRRLLLPDERSWEVAVTPLDTQGGCVLVARDVSEGVRLETVRRDFVAALSHELRTPLTSIQGYAELLQQPDLAPADRAEYLDVIVQNTERLNRLAQDLVLLSSLETGAYQFRFERLPADSLAAPALAVMAPLARELHCRLELAASQPGWVYADRDALHRVLLNLLENAMVHGRAQGERAPPLKVLLSGRAEGRDYVWRVRDNGPGIAAGDQARVFERFYQVGAGHTTPARGRRGAGLGLAVVKHVVREHGGEVAVESALGQGSTFLVRLPLVDNGETP
ncbi:MAG TPA: ATP-binding protein [Terriglobales bacterium]|nr:ATP-binding protein [Terriglobales bacterium]